MDIQAALRFPFRGPKPWTNILLLGVCNLIPIIGPIVGLGYAAMIEKQLARNLDTEPLLFDFSNFTKYLERGVAPFLVSLIASLVLLPIIWGGVALVMVLSFLAAAAFRGSPWPLVFVIPLSAIALLALIIVWTVLLVPLTLRASLLGRIGDAFDLRWALDFLKRVFWTALGYLLLMGLIGFALILAGECTLLIGMYFALAIVGLMQAHIYMQLYHLYLDRGGTPLTIIDDPIPPAFPVVMPPPLPPR